MIKLFPTKSTGFYWVYLLLLFRGRSSSARQRAVSRLGFFYLEEFAALDAGLRSIFSLALISAMPIAIFLRWFFTESRHHFAAMVARSVGLLFLGLPIALT